MKKQNIKNFSIDFIIGLSAIILYFLLNYIETLPFEIVGINVDTINPTVKIIYSFFYSIFMIGVIGVLFHKKLLKDIKDIKENYKSYYAKYIKYWLIGLAVMFISNSIIVFIFNGGISNNEEIIRDMFKINPLYVYFSAVFFAPFVEELVFRRGIRNMIPNNIIYILISGLSFGILHVFSSASTIIDLLYVIPYSSLGIVFAYMLVKTDNIFVSMGFHFLHNALLLNLQFIILLFS